MFDSSPNIVPTTPHSRALEIPDPVPPAQPQSFYSVHPMQTRSKSNISLPKSRTDGTIFWPPPRAHIATVPIPEEPSAATEASKFSEWRHVM